MLDAALPSKLHKLSYSPLQLPLPNNPFHSLCPTIMFSCGNLMPYMCVIFKHLLFAFKIIWSLCFNTDLAHQLNAGSSCNPFTTAYSAISMGSLFFTNLKLNYSILPPLYCTQTLCPWKSFFGTLSALAAVQNQSSPFNALSVTQLSIIFSKFLNICLSE